MSHFATNWAIQQRGLKPATKIVLWHLCDRHNPDFGCFPTQARLAVDCEMSVSSLNDHLRALEDARLIHRLRCHDPQTHRRQATRYILGFEDRFPDPLNEGDDGGSDAGDDGDSGDPCPDSGDGAISEKSPKPSPSLAGFHLRNSETNPVREPLREPVKEEEGARARDDRFEEFFGRLLDALGFDTKASLPGWWQGWPPREHVRRWITDLGLTEERIVAVARNSRSTHPEPPDGPRALDRTMERAARTVGAPKPAEGDKRRKRGRKPSDTPRASMDAIADFYAGLVNGDGYLPSNAISNTVRNAMLERGLVTAERLKARGVA
ncbi:helix-turn-helix domain-containing protein [Paracoccus sp. R12_1]|uniref:helix-turn-helix domain-containing protein n=1 Tax=unclassified Paracoccus (in: a-proteobacteria) TaxID=2688777 RepID=UPI001ADB31F7|nr:MULTISPECIES: helix-turn-helix domain-containing protein [unclassified Paracoccus (in: a-proteobacteria)]MBO9457015.1 helix-turn-helix domain-containing protein [Paracoccus sp. R12_2]MBO9488100.1 helix-turn-helix domain-containing protein [Paracoccus sp. R12_1]